MKSGEDLVRALVEDTQDAYAPRDEDYQRVLTKLRSAPASAANRGRWSLGRSGLGLLATSALLVGVVSIARQSHLEPPPPVALRAEDRITAASESPSPSVEPTTKTVPVEALPSVVSTTVPRAARPVPLPSAVRPAPSPSGSTTSSLAEEIRLLRAASDASRASNFAGALAFVDEHERRFPKGVLADERRVQKVLVLCDLDRESQARAEARRFTVDRPSSPLNARLSSSCAAEEKSGQ